MNASHKAVVDRVRETLDTGRVRGVAVDPSDIIRLLGIVATLSQDLDARELAKPATLTAAAVYKAVQEALEVGAPGIGERVRNAIAVSIGLKLRDLIKLPTNEEATTR